MNERHNLAPVRQSGVRLYWRDIAGRANPRGSGTSRRITLIRESTARSYEMAQAACFGNGYRGKTCGSGAPKDGFLAEDILWVGY
jgi:hypothetical protein